MEKWRTGTLRLIDFEAYEANGNTLYAAIWKPKVDDEEVRF